MSVLGPAFEAVLAEVEAERSRRCWAAWMLTRDRSTCRSILANRPVRVGTLDRFVLRRALRGGPLPDPETYLVVTAGMLAAVNEAGPLPERRGR